MALDLGSLRNAVSSLESALLVAGSKKRLAIFSQAERQVIKAGVIQNFELTYELCWKFMKRWIEANVGRFLGEGVARRELFRRSAENGLVSSVERWMDFHEAHNQTAHTCDAHKAREIVKTSRSFLKDAKALLSALEKRNE